MAKFNVSVDIDLFESATETDFEQIIKEKVLEQATKTASDKILESVDKHLTDIMQEKKKEVQSKIDERLASIMDDFLTRRRTVTDQWGNKKNEYSVEEMMQESCDSYMSKMVDSNGKENPDSYNRTTRIAYLLKQAVDSKMQYSIDSAIRQIKENVTKYVDTNIKAQLGEKVAEAIGLNKVKL